MNWKKLPTDETLPCLSFARISEQESDRRKPEETEKKQEKAGDLPRKEPSTALRQLGRRFKI